jgi:pyruvate carboxylase
MAGRTSQPTLSGIVSATDFTDRATGLSLGALLDLEPYWEAVRSSYAPFETRMRAPTGRLYRHQIPGGQLSNLRQQSIALGLGERFEEIEAGYVRANLLLGDIVKVTPTSKVVGDLALFVVSGGIDWDDLSEHPERFDLPDSVLAFLRGELGEPAGGLPQPFAERALRGATSPDSSDTTDAETAQFPDPGPSRRAALSELMFPGPFRDQRDAREHYGDVSVIPTLPFFYGLKEDAEHAIDLEPGVRLVVGLEAIGEPDARGMRTVLTRLNGQLRPIDVRDESIQVTSVAVERADPKDPDHVAAPLAGIVTVQVKEDAEVSEGDAIAVLEAMKMESTITAPHAGRVARIAAPSGGRLEQGDLILVLETAKA